VNLNHVTWGGLWIAAVLALTGCEGVIGSDSATGSQRGSNGPNGADPNADSDGDGIPDSEDPTPGVAVDPADPNAAGPMPLRRLNRREYNNTVRDLLGTTSRPADEFTEDNDGDFLFPRAGIVSILDAELLQAAAESLVSNLDIGALLPCDPSSGEEACAMSFIESFGLKAYRRPLLGEEKDRLKALYDKARGELALDFESALGVVVEAILQSPAFLYRWELGPQLATMDGPVAKLGPYEIASRLSYFLWRSMPDQALFDAAAGGLLGTEAEVIAQAQRLLGDTKARESVASFFSDWLRMSQDAIEARDKDTTLYPEWQPDLQAAMAAETDQFVTGVIFEGDGTFQSLLTSPSSGASGALATLYGGGSGTLNAVQRGGLLTRAAFLTVTGAANGSNPVKRGKRIFQGLMCQELQPPPGVVIPPADPPEAGGTTRERFERHEENACASCHQVLDPLGFAFENYDGIGKWRDTDNGGPVDASGTLTLDGAPVSFNNGVELSTALAGSAEVRACFAKQWVRYALDRLETDYDKASIDNAAKLFSDGNFTVPALLVGVASTRSFRYRMLAEGEVSP
jgi:hypothetical protein